MSQRGIEYREELAEVMLRLTDGRSYRQLAKAASVSPSTIGNMVMGRVPGQQVCIAVALALGVEPHVLLEPSGLPVPDAVEAVNMALRGVELPEEGKKQIREFAQEIRDKFKGKNND